MYFEGIQHNNPISDLIQVERRFLQARLYASYAGFVKLQPVGRGVGKRTSIAYTKLSKPTRKTKEVFDQLLKHVKTWNDATTTLRIHKYLII